MFSICYNKKDFPANKLKIIQPKEKQNLFKNAE
jgi:hypothetical protein